VEFPLEYVDHIMQPNLICGFKIGELSFNRDIRLHINK